MMGTLACEIDNKLLKSSKLCTCLTKLCRNSFYVTYFCRKTRITSTSVHGLCTLSMYDPKTITSTWGLALSSSSFAPFLIARSSAQSFETCSRRLMAFVRIYCYYWFSYRRYFCRRRNSKYFDSLRGSSKTGGCYGNYYLLKLLLLRLCLPLVGLPLSGRSEPLAAESCLRLAEWFPPRAADLESCRILVNGGAYIASSSCYESFLKLTCFYAFLFFRDLLFLFCLLLFYNSIFVVPPIIAFWWAVFRNKL